MARFYEYKVISADGSIVTGESQADSVKVVYDQLVSRGYSVVSVEPKRKSGFTFDLSALDRLFQKPIKDDDITTFTTLFGTMLKAGVPHHGITVRSEVRQELRQLAELMNIQVIEI